MSKNKNGFTLIEMMVAIPIALIMITSLVGATLFLTNQTIIVNEKARKTADIHRALSIIEQDISLSNKFLSKITLKDHDNQEITTSSIDKIYLSNSVKNGISPVYDESDKPKPPFDDKQPRIILQRLATTTNPDSKNYLKKISHFKEGPHNGENCRYNNPVFLNIVYFIRDSSLYRRTVIHSKRNTSGNITRDDEIFCSFNNSGVNYSEVPWQLPTCNKNDFSKPEYSDYCLAKDELLVDQVEMKTEYFHGTVKLDEDLIYHSDSVIQQNTLDEADRIEITLTGKIILTEGDSETITKARLSTNRLPIIALDQ